MEANRRAHAWCEPGTGTPSPTADMRTRSSFFRRREESDSPSEREDASASTSSMKTIAGWCCVALSNRVRTSFSLSPTHLLVRSEEEMEKKVASTSVATALARCDLPVPGGPYSRIPRHGLRSPVKSDGKRSGSTTASLSASLAGSRPATSSQCTLGRSVTIALSSAEGAPLLAEGAPPPRPGVQRPRAAAP